MRTRQIGSSYKITTLPPPAPHARAHQPAEPPGVNKGRPEVVMTGPSALQTTWHHLSRQNPPPLAPTRKTGPYQPAEPPGISKRCPEVVNDQSMSTADCLAPAEEGCHLLALSHTSLSWRPSALPSPCQYTLCFAAQLLAVHQHGQLHTGTVS